MSCITRIQILRGPTLQRLQIIPLIAELVFDTDELQIYIGDGVTPGGNPLQPVPPRVQAVSTNNALILGNEDDVIHNPTADATVTLPSAVGRTKPLNYMNASAFKVDMLTVGGQTINGQPANEFLANYPYSAITLVPAGGQWYVF